MAKRTFWFATVGEYAQPPYSVTVDTENYIRPDPKPLTERDVLLQRTRELLIRLERLAGNTAAPTRRRDET